MSAAPARARSTTQQPGPLAALVLALFVAAPAVAPAAPRVVVTVKPLHSLVAGVMDGVGEPELLISGSGSPHTFNLKPSAARLLERAQVVFWVGESLETFMGRPLAALGGKARIVAATLMPGIALLPGRPGGAWDGHGGQSGDDGHDHAHDSATDDGHLWLDPANARVIARETAKVLGRADPDNRARYAANADAVVARIDALDAGLEAALAPVREIPFVVFHDAYQYFEKRYALRAVGSITVSAERAPGARRVQEIRDTIRRLEARCVFSEPQFSPAILATLLEDSSIRSGTLDPLGAELVPGPDAYFTLMRGLGAALRECLRPR